MNKCLLLFRSVYYILNKYLTGNHLIPAFTLPKINLSGPPELTFIRFVEFFNCRMQFLHHKCSRAVYSFDRFRKKIDKTLKV